MTRAEAIKILQANLSIWNDTFCKSKDNALKDAVNMAIEALSQDSTEDCISRKAAIDAIPNPWCTSDGNIYNTINIVHKIMDLPSVQPKHGEWISVEDRLPENPANKVLATVEYSTGSRYVLFAHYEKHIGWWNLETDELFDESGDKVMAWQPLPEPYKQICPSCGCFMGYQ